VDAGRVVVFPSDRRTRGYLVKSEAEELKIRSFLKMFFFALLSVFILGYFLAHEWSMWLVYDLGRPAAHLFRTSCICLGIYSLVVGLPYLLLWRICKKALLSFVSAQDEVLVSAKLPSQRQILIRAGLVAFGVLIALVAVALGLVFLTRS
jgi:hypothetical protein